MRTARIHRFGMDSFDEFIRTSTSPHRRYRFPRDIERERLCFSSSEYLFLLRELLRRCRVIYRQEKCGFSDSVFHNKKSERKKRFLITTARGTFYRFLAAQIDF